MQTSVTFKNIDSSDHLKAYVNNKLSRFDRFLDVPAEANVVLAVEKHRHIAEIHVSGGRLNVNGKEETDDMYAAIDNVLDKLEKQIKRNKDKKRDKRGKGGEKAGAIAAGPVAFAEPDLAEGEREEEAEIIVKAMDFKPMDAEEAVMQLELAEEAFIVFTDAKTNRTNVIYRRSDGHFGLIQPRN